MGEQVYRVPRWTQGGNWEDAAIQFSEGDDETACLCTFPHNFEQTGLDTERVRSLALLGAAVVLAHQGELKEEYNYLPYCVPQWIRDGIASALKA